MRQVKSQAFNYKVQGSLKPFIFCQVKSQVYQNSGSSPFRSKSESLLWFTLGYDEGVPSSADIQKRRDVDQILIYRWANRKVPLQKHLAHFPHVSGERMFGRTWETMCLANRLSFWSVRPRLAFPLLSSAILNVPRIFHLIYSCMYLVILCIFCILYYLLFIDLTIYLYLIS